MTTLIVILSVTVVLLMVCLALALSKTSANSDQAMERYIMNHLLKRASK